MSRREFNSALAVHRRTSRVDQLTADAVFRIAGVALEGAVMWRREREDDLPLRREEFGGNVQLSYLLPWFDLQAVVRYSGLLDPDTGGSGPAA